MHKAHPRGRGASLDGRRGSPDAGLFDRNHLSGALRKVSRVRDINIRARRAGHRFICSHPIICELEVGSSRPRNQTTIVADWRSCFATSDSGRSMPKRHGSTARPTSSCGKRVCALSQFDMILVALARQHKLADLTTDRDFEAFRRI